VGKSPSGCEPRCGAGVAEAFGGARPGRRAHSSVRGDRAHPERTLELVLVVLAVVRDARQPLAPTGSRNANRPGGDAGSAAPPSARQLIRARAAARESPPRRGSPRKRPREHAREAARRGPARRRKLGERAGAARYEPRLQRALGMHEPGPALRGSRSALHVGDGSIGAGSSRSMAPKAHVLAEVN
jgi:hypothetical protein